MPAMDQETANLVLFAITAGCLVAWCAGLWFLSISRRAGRPAQTAQFGLEEPAPENLVTGTADVEGPPADLAAKTASVLARENAASLGHLKILERTGDRVVFEGIGPGMSGGSHHLLVRRGEVFFKAAGANKSVVEYRIEIAARRGLLLGGAIFQVVGLVALIAGFLLIRNLVVPHPDPAVRWQTLQMLQVSHFLWPPFLFGGLYRRMRSVVRTRFDALIHNLPYVE